MINYRNKIVILICYYGGFPWYFPYFLNSCSFNPSIDFLIFSDIQHTFLIPDNVKFINKTITEIKNLATTKIGVDVNIDFPYKLCDFKPAYGLIFEHYIRDYDFWGQSDIDIIYGNIRKFMTDELLSKNDYISIRHDYTTGCFSLYRNTQFINNIFKRSKDYKTVFSDSKHYCFDECNFAWDELRDGKSIFDVPTEIESFTHIVLAAKMKNEIRAHFDFLLIEGLVGRIKFNKGTIIYKNKYEGILYHLFWFKKYFFPEKIPKIIPDVYCISRNKIYTK